MLWQPRLPTHSLFSGHAGRFGVQAQGLGFGVEGAYLWVSGWGGGCRKAWRTTIYKCRCKARHCTNKPCKLEQSEIAATLCPIPYGTHQASDPDLAGLPRPAHALLFPYLLFLLLGRQKHAGRPQIGRLSCKKLPWQHDHGHMSLMSAVAVAFRLSSNPLWGYQRKNHHVRQ